MDLFQERLRHPDTRTVNIFNTSVRAWSRYYRFLQILQDRYNQAVLPYVEVVLREHERMQEEAK